MRPTVVVVPSFTSPVRVDGDLQREAGDPHMDIVGYRVEALAYLTEERPGHVLGTDEPRQMINLGDWYGPDAQEALGRLSQRARHIAELLTQDSDYRDTASRLWSWLAGDDFSPQGVDRLRQGCAVSHLLPAGNNYFEFCVRPVPIAPAPHWTPAPAWDDTRLPVRVPGLPSGPTPAGEGTTSPITSDRK
jgi:hypothetical protein